MVEVVEKQVQKSLECRRYSHKEVCKLCMYTPSRNCPNIEQQEALDWWGVEWGGLHHLPSRPAAGQGHGPHSFNAVRDWQVSGEESEANMYVQEDRWVKEVFPAILKQTKWTKNKEYLQVGDVALRRDETAAGQTHKKTQVIKLHSELMECTLVQSAHTEYRFPWGGEVWRGVRGQA